MVYRTSAFPMLDRDEAAYLKIREFPTSSLSVSSHQMNFSAPYLAKQIDQLIKGFLVQSEKFEMASIPFFPVPPNKATLVDWDTTQLDKFAFTRLSSLLLVEKSNELIFDTCKKMGGNLPRPTTHDEQQLFKDILTKLSLTQVPIAVQLWHGSITYDDGTLLDRNPKFSDVFYTTAATPTVVTSPYTDLVKQSLTQIAVLTSSLQVTFLDRSQDAVVSKGLCIVPRLSSRGVGNSEGSVKDELIELGKLITDLVQGFNDFKLALDRSNFREVKASVSDMLLPEWLSASSDLLTTIQGFKSRADDALLVSDLQSSVRSLMSQVSFSKEILKSNLLDLGEIVCTINSTTVLNCVSDDNTRRWVKVEFVPLLSSSGYQLAFSNVLHEVIDSSWIGCLTEMSSSVFNMLSDECCEALRMNSPEAWSTCPSNTVSNKFLGARVGKLIVKTSTDQQVWRRCDKGSPEEISSSSFVPFDSCDFQISDHGVFSTFLNLLARGNRVSTLFSGIKRLTEKDRTFYIFWGTVGGACLLVLIVLVTCTCLCCPDYAMKCLPKCCWFILKCLLRNQFVASDSKVVSLNDDIIEAFRVGLDNAVSNRNAEQLMLENFALRPERGSSRKNRRRQSASDN